MRYIHPFDSYRARRAYAELATRLSLPAEAALRRDKNLGGRFGNVELVIPQGPITDQELLLVHSAEYLQSLRTPSVVATALEVVSLAIAPLSFLEWTLLTPMRWAVTGTLLAAREALRTGLAFSLAGGFHHAKPRRGEGFCLVNDIAYAFKTLQAEGRIKTALYVDLDAHQGNGVSVVFLGDHSLKLFDVYNGSIFPYDEEEARERLDVSIPLDPGTSDRIYLETLERELPRFFDAYPQADLVIYNAGNDIVAGDRLGGLDVSPQGVLARDLLVIEEAQKRKMPLVFLPSGGYTRESYSLITRTVLSAVAGQLSPRAAG